MSGTSKKRISMDIVEALEPFGVHLPDGRPMSVAQGDKFAANDPIVKGREKLFGPVVLRSSLPSAAPSAPAPARAVETASAAPGERRSRSSKSAADKEVSDR